MRLTAALLAAAMAASIALPARADRPGPDWMPLDQAFRTLTEAGYRDVTELEADDGAWEAEATKDGKRVDVKVDPRTGTISVKPHR
jgi:hypothetical protein